jgi:S1-C subfamily serine protease
VEHPTAGYDTESGPPESSAGLDYTFSAPAPPPQRVVVERTSPLPMAIIAFLSAIVGALLTVAILSVAGFFDTEAVTASTVPVTSSPTTTLAQPAAVTSPTGSAMIEAVWAKVYPSVVTVLVFQESDDLPFASGSGVALGDGYVVTNHHVIEDADIAQITLQDGRTYDAAIVGSDALTDLAVLSVDATDLKPVEIGSVDDLSIGQTTIAVGNPLGQTGGSSLTVGVLSALSRRVDFEDGTDPLFGMLQTDAPITNGSSGGALVDDEGRLIGITSAIGLSEAGAEGIGYAIPVDVVLRVTDELIETGAASHAFLGIRGDTSIEIGEDTALVPNGAVIVEIDPADGAAGRAGLEADDVIVAIEGITITTMDDLVIQLRLHRAGEILVFEVVRDGATMTVPVTLDERPEGT